MEIGKKIIEADKREVFEEAGIEIRERQCSYSKDQEKSMRLLYHLIVAEKYAIGAQYRPFVQGFDNYQ